MNSVLQYSILGLSILTLFCIIVLSYQTYKDNGEYFTILDDDEIDFSDSSRFVETQHKLTPAEIILKKQLRKKLPQPEDDEIDFSDPSRFIETQHKLTPEEIILKKQLRKELEIEKQKEHQIEQQLSQLNTGYSPDYSGNSNCTTRCDCCWKNPNSNDRVTACHKKYKVGSSQLNECLTKNSKYAHEACKSSFGKGLIFKSC